MSADRTGEPLFDPDDPASVERHRRWLEREERRRKRQVKKAGNPAGAAPASRAAREPLLGRVTDALRRTSPPPPPPPDPPPDPPRPPAPDPLPREPSRPPRPTRPRLPADLPAALLGNWRRLVAAVGALVLIWFLFALFQPFHGEGEGKVVVHIPDGASAGEVGDILDDRGVVTSGTLFEVRATLAGKRSELYPGTYTLASGMSYGDAINAVSTPPEKRTITLTVPEGLSRSQVAPLARGAGVQGSYMKASVRSRYINPARYGAKGAKNLEGFLFPATYELPARGSATDFVQLQVQAFRQRIRHVNMRYARSKNLTTYDVLIVASMIEREVQVPDERKLVAAVIYNRLHDGMPLGIDATTRFAVGNYTKPLTNSQLQTPSPYNTRVNVGLPPGPIGNPGIAAIEAAAHPADVNYLFYVVKPGTCGEHSFSSSEAQFARDQAAYQRALEAKGGSPTSCPSG